MLLLLQAPTVLPRSILALFHASVTTAHSLQHRVQLRSRTEWALMVVLVIAANVAALRAQAGGAKACYKSIADVQYAQVGDQKLLLDLFIPATTAKPPLVVFIHGGGWRSGSRKDVFPLFLAKNGYAVASIEYRLSQVAVFPAQIFDCKGAVRWLRAHAGDYGYDRSRVVAMGTSAGGHLAVLLGTSGGVSELEGDVGGHLDQSSRVQAVADFFGPADFILRSEDQPQQTDKEGGKVYQLLGKPVKQNEAFARLASGAFHVTADDPPMLVVHGTADKTVFPNQSKRICDVYQSLGLKAEFHSIEGAGHGGPAFSSAECQQWVLEFLKRELKH